MTRVFEVSGKKTKAENDLERKVESCYQERAYKWGEVKQLKTERNGRKKNGILHQNVERIK